LPVLLLAVVFALALDGCSQASIHDSTAGLDPGQDTPASTGVDVVGEGDPLVIGSPEATTTEIILTNQTDQTIVGVQIRDVDAPAYGAQLFGPDDRWTDDQRLILHLDLGSLGVARDGEAGGTDASQGREGAAIAFNPQYDLRLTMADGSLCELHALNLEGLVDARVRVEDDIVYLVYREGDTEASTLEAERARL
jgi:hypothetical protein